MNVFGTIAKLRREQPAAIDEYVANVLRGSSESALVLSHRAHLVTALREAKLWPASERPATSH